MYVKFDYNFASEGYMCVCSPFSHSLLHQGCPFPNVFSCPACALPLWREEPPDDNAAPTLRPLPGPACRWIGIWYSVCVAEMVVVKHVCSTVQMTTWGRSFYMVRASWALPNPCCPMQLPA